MTEAALTQAVTLEASLTAGGEPLEGAGIKFFVTGSGPNGWTGQSVGGADTDANGIARVTLDGGLANEVLPSQQVTGYQAEFFATGSVDDDGDYCRSKGESPISG
ncbi:hypothetical protein BH20ACT2_BH20ACT2_17720 [soil metagenome]